MVLPTRTAAGQCGPSGGANPPPSTPPGTRAAHGPFTTRATHPVHPHPPPVSPSTTLTGGTPWQDEKAKARAKKKAKKAGKAAARAAAAGTAEGDGAAADADAALKAALPKSYDEEFGLEAAARRAALGAAGGGGPGASAAHPPPPGAVGPHGHKFRAAPAVLHGYSAAVTGRTAEERLDMRAAAKGDKFCR